MAKRKEETVADRVDHVSRSLWRSANSIRGTLDNFEKMEKYIDEDAKNLFRSHVQMIRIECDNLHDGSEPTTEPKS